MRPKKVYKVLDTVCAWVYTRDMDKQRITNLAECRITRPQTSMDTIKLEARHTGSPIVIEHVAGRWLVVLPGGAVLGASGEPQGAFWAEHTAWSIDGGNDYQVVVDKVVGR
jgi:hypothetical protein